MEEIIIYTNEKIKNSLKILNEKINSFVLDDGT